MALFERAAVLVFVLAPVAACNVIAGLDGFQKVSCDESCGDGGPEVGSDGPIPEAGPDADSGQFGDDGPLLDEPEMDGPIVGADDGGDGGEGGDDGGDAEAGISIDRTWARWVMPNPAPSGDAGGGASLPNPAHYDTSTEDVVGDLVTGLVWKNVAAPATSLQQATDACPSPWRVPTRIELVSILDTTRPSAPYANPAFSFGAVQLWTRSTTPSGGSWSVSFSDGTVTPQPSTPPTRVLCVQGGV